MNKAIFLLSIVVAAGSGYWLGKSNNPSNNTISSVAFVEPESTITPAAVNFPQIDLERNSRHSKTLFEKAEPSLPRQNPTTADQPTQHQIDAIKTEYEFKQRSESFKNWLITNQQTKPWFDLGTEMRGRFDAEEIDHAWASTQEGRLQSIFIQEQALAGIAVKSTVCRSTQCQITIGVMDHNHANETSMAIIETLSAEKFSHIIIDNQVQLGEATFYVSSNKKGFELYQ